MAAAWVIARAETSRGSGAGPGHENIENIISIRECYYLLFYWQWMSDVTDETYSIYLDISATDIDIYLINAKLISYYFQYYGIVYLCVQLQKIYYLVVCRRQKLPSFVFVFYSIELPLRLMWLELVNPLLTSVIVHCLTGWHVNYVFMCLCSVL